MEQSKGKTRKEEEGKRKCEKIMRETFGKKNYITKNKVGEVRNIFKARVGMSEFAEVAGKRKQRGAKSEISICKSDDSKHSMLWHLWQQSKKSQYTCPKNMTGSFQNGRTSSKMWGPAFNIVSLPKIACKIVRPFKPDFRERWQVSEFSVSSRKTRSDQGNSRSRLEA